MLSKCLASLMLPSPMGKQESKQEGRSIFWLGGHTPLEGKLRGKGTDSRCQPPRTIPHEAPFSTDYSGLAGTGDLVSVQQLLAT